MAMMLYKFSDRYDAEKAFKIMKELSEEEGWKYHYHFGNENIRYLSKVNDSGQTIVRKIRINDRDVALTDFEDSDFPWRAG